MTKTELKIFRRTLENLQGELRNGNRNREAMAVEASSDQLDRIQHASDRDYAMDNLERSSRRLREVQTAISRIDSGTFGVCVGCEENINPRRLAAVPWASSCIVCQEAADRGQETSHIGMDTSLVMTA
jgi:DnaK suppressor protein